MGVVDETTTLELLLCVADLLGEDEWVPLGDMKPASEVKSDLQPALENESTAGSQATTQMSLSLPHVRSDTRGSFPTLPNTVPCMLGVERLAPETVFELLKCNQCVLVDTRGNDRSSGCIAGAVHVPAINGVPFAKRVPAMMKKFGDKTMVVFHCQYSCHKAPTCANMFRRLAHPSQQVAVLDGGFRGWESAGLPIQF